MGNRFDCVIDPLNRFEIWDHKRCLPVMRYGRLLSYATRRRAERATALLNLAAGSRRCWQSSAVRQPVRADGNAKSSFFIARIAERWNRGSGDKDERAETRDLLAIVSG